MQFNLFDIVLLMIIVVASMQFWRIRAISEQAKAYLQRYCEQNGLQLLSIARRKTRLTRTQGRIDWYNEFHFEFSSTGEDSYEGELVMSGLKVLKTELPAYRIN
jgi:hypothetical protein